MHPLLREIMAVGKTSAASFLYLIFHKSCMFPIHVSSFTILVIVYLLSGCQYISHTVDIEFLQIS